MEALRRWSSLRKSTQLNYTCLFRHSNLRRGIRNLLSWLNLFDLMPAKEYRRFWDCCCLPLLKKSSLTTCAWLRESVFLLYSAAMEQHRITCEEEGRYVGKYPHSNHHSITLLHSRHLLKLLCCVTLAACLNRGWDGPEPYPWAEGAGVQHAVLGTRLCPSAASGGHSSCPH